MSEPQLANKDEGPGEALTGCSGHVAGVDCDITKSVRDEITLKVKGKFVSHQAAR